ncbi:MAG: GNAT family N-acetyltransferase [Defluviitaleaceae bacterium]|nr:GNAT family N-acetyltransferase [Defluviitaleaceae bacterium]
MNFCEKLETERLILRLATLDDADAFYSWGSCPENVRWMAWGPNTMEQTRDYLKTVRKGMDFAVVSKESGAVIGSCGIYPDSAGDTGELGWVLHKNHHKQGFGTEICAKLIRYGFKELNLRRITAPCAAVNYGSYRIMERNGMRREALHIKKFWARVDKEWVDEAVYAILAEEYNA